MIINDFLNFKLGVIFEDKYNELAIREVLENKNKYNLIYDEINNLVEYNEDETIKYINYDSSFFDCDDLELCAGYDETMELYKVFLKVFSEDIRNKNYKLKHVSFGKDYLRLPSITCILDPYYNYTKVEFVNIYEKDREIGSVIVYPNIIDGNYYGHLHKKEFKNTFCVDNTDLLTKLKESFNKIIDYNLLITQRFENNDLKNNKVQIDDQLDGYFYNYYTFLINQNIIKIFTTQNDLTVFNDLFKQPILDSLTNEEKIGLNYE